MLNVADVSLIMNLQIVCKLIFFISSMLIKLCQIISFCYSILNYTLTPLYFIKKIKNYLHPYLGLSTRLTITLEIINIYANQHIIASAHFPIAIGTHQHINFIIIISTSPDSYRDTSAH